MTALTDFAVAKYRNVVAKPRVRVDAHGWIRHDGMSKPNWLPERQLIGAIMRCGLTYDRPAGFFGACWINEGTPYDIIAFRIIREPRP